MINKVPMDAYNLNREIFLLLKEGVLEFCDIDQAGVWPKMAEKAIQRRALRKMEGSEF